jgi:hypothetical protein
LGRTFFFYTKNKKSILSFIESRPHPIGSWGIYLPLEQFTEAASFISMYHGNLTVLLHPNSGHPKIDHLLNAFWIKSFLPLDGKSPSSHFPIYLGFFFCCYNCRRSIERHCTTTTSSKIDPTFHFIVNKHLFIRIFIDASKNNHNNNNQYDNTN